MKRPLILFGIVLMAADAAFAGPIVIGGTSSTAPPSFVNDAFAGLTQTLETGFSFTVTAGGPFIVEEAEVAVYHYPGTVGDTATFTIYSDVSGSPGASLVHFDVPGISTTQQVLAALPSASIMLESGSTYWFVGSTSQGQVNWNITNTFGPEALRVSGGAWDTSITAGNRSAFVVLGSQVPEPASFLLVGSGLGILSLAAWRRKK